MIMKKNKWFLVVFLFIGFILFSQNDYEKQIYAKAELFLQATKKHDFKTIVRYTYPKLAKHLTKDTLYAQVSNKMVALKKEGLRYKKIYFDKPSQLFKNEHIYYCVLPLHLTQINSQGKVSTDTFLFAVSEDRGVDWTFLTDEQFNTYKDILFSKLDENLNIPKKSQTFTRNNSFTSFNKPN